MLCCFLPYINRSQPQVYICPLPLEPPSHLPPHPNPSRLSQSTALSSLLHTAKSHWLSLLHTVMYMFQCCSFSSSHTLLPLLCPEVCSSVRLLSQFCLWYSYSLLASLSFLSSFNSYPPPPPPAPQSSPIGPSPPPGQFSSFHVNQGLPWWLSSKEYPCNAGDRGDMDSIPGLGRPPRRRKQKPTLIFLPGESHGQRSLVGCSPRGVTKSLT